MTLKEALLNAGYPEKDMFHWYSDLYVFKNAITDHVIKTWYRENNLKQELFCNTFIDQITGKTMYECAFAW